MKKEKRQKMCLEIIDQFEQLLEEKDLFHVRIPQKKKKDMTAVIMQEFTVLNTGV